MKKLVLLTLSAIFVLSSVFMGACNQTESDTTPKSVSIKYTDAQTIMQLLVDDTLEFGLLPEPAASTLQKVKGKNFTWTRLSLQELYDKETKSYPQAVLMVKNDVLQDYPQIVRKMHEKFTDNATWVSENASLAVNAIKTNFASSTLNPNVIDKTVVDNCKISWQDAQSAKGQVKSYIQNILSVNDSDIVAPAVSVDDDFFHLENNFVGNDVNGKNFTFYAPDGAPALSIAKFIADGENFVEGATFNYNVVVADNIAKYMNGALGKADFIVLPVNAASKLYKTQNYTMVSVLTHGNLYIMAKVKDGNTQISLDDLNGKKIGVIGQGLVPDLTLKAVLSKNTFEYSIAN